MKAAVLYKPREPLVFEELDIDEPEPGEALVKIAASGICGSDVHVIDGIRAPRNLPVILGHEGAGIVEAVGEGVTFVKPGDHVIISMVPFCGYCFYCVRGQVRMCENAPAGPAPGTSRFHSGGRDVFGSLLSTFSEYTIVPERACIKIRDDAPLDVVCLIGCGVVTGVGAVFNTAQVKPGSTVAVFGSGGVGLNIIQAAALAGATTIIAVDLLPNKLEKAIEFGATHGVNASQEDPVAAVHRITKRGADYSFEVLGVTEVFEQSFAATRPGGDCITLGTFPAGTTLPVDPTRLNEYRRVVGCTYGSSQPTVDFPMMVDMYMSGKLHLDELISLKRPLSEINEVLAAIQTGLEVRTVVTNPGWS